MKKSIKLIMTALLLISLLVTNIAMIFSYAASGTYELAFDNLFVFEQWANNVKSGSVTGNGTITKDIAAGSFTLTNNSSTEVFTSHSMNPDPAGNTGYYTMDVEPSTSYIFSYNVDSGSTTGSFDTFVFMFDASNAYVTLDTRAATNYGVNQWTFTTTDTTETIQVRFDVNDAKTAVVKDIRICKEADYNSYVSQLPIRYTYNTANVSTYGTLPEPARDNLVFAGWFTGKNGTGEHITSDREILDSSYTVYSKWDPIASNISIETLPVKQSYSVGEKLNKTGLSIKVTYPDSTTEVLSSGFVCTPTELNSTGTQTITVTYGGKTATFNVNVSLFTQNSVIINNVEKTVNVTNKKYTIDYTASAFNRFELTYSTDAYIRGVMTMAGVTEEFFLEPSENGSFSSFIDGFLDGTTRTQIDSIKFECLDNDNSEFTLFSITTSKATVPSQMLYLSDSHYEIGVDLNWGGALSHLVDLDSNVVAAKYSNSGTKVDFASKIPSGSTGTSNKVNLINANDTGRLVQQSYYGTGSAPYVPGDYNGIPWNYNPVQGGNVKNEASKIVDYKITDNELYIKCRPLDWGKWSDEFAAANNIEARYGEDYITDSYMEAVYKFENGVIKAECRFVDYSGYPSTATTQELPAFYCVDPLEDFVYYENDQKIVQENLQFWGDYPEQGFTCEESWAAFISDGHSSDSFGIGLYTPGQTYFKTGLFQHGTTRSTDPAHESATAYIAVVDTMLFESYSPFSYKFYISTGTAEEIRSGFEYVAENENSGEGGDVVVPDESIESDVIIAVPETIYLQPVNGQATTSQYFANTYLDGTTGITVKSESPQTKGYIGLYAPGAESFKLNVTTVTSGIGEFNLTGGDGTPVNVENQSFGVTNDKFEYNLLSGNISGTGLTPGQTAVIKWEVEITTKDGAISTYYAYSTVYAPHRTVGAVAESRRSGTYNNEISSWITGINGISSSLSPLSGGNTKGDKQAQGYFKYDPLYNGLPSGGSSESTDDFVTASSTEKYVYATAPDGSDWSRSLSYVGLLTVDSSRYNDTQYIPNFSYGIDVLRIQDNKKDSLRRVYGEYTFAADAAGLTGTDENLDPDWTEFCYKYEAQNPFREQVKSPSRAVSGLNGMYLHIICHGYCVYISSDNYATACTSVRFSVTDKSSLRKTTVDAFGFAEEAYTSSSYSALQSALNSACAVLGNPAANQSEINSAKTTIDKAKASLVRKKYNISFDNIFNFSEYKNAGISNTSDVTSTGFTIYNDSTSAGSEKVTNETKKIPVTPGETYTITADISSTSGSNEMFMFFSDANGAWLLNGGINSTAKENGTFTVPSGASYVSFRFDSNGAQNTASYDNIRVYKNDGIQEEVTVEIPTIGVDYRSSVPDACVPTRPGYTFMGWYNGNTKYFDASGESVVSAVITEDISLSSQWMVNNDSLTADVVVADFGLPVDIYPFDNDVIYNKEAARVGSGNNKFLGISLAGREGVYASTVSSQNGVFEVTGSNVTFTPSKVISEVKTIYYHASISKKIGNETVSSEVIKPITFVPASNILFEENYFTEASGSNASWTGKGESASYVQSGNDDSVYGFDSSYDVASTYSNGTYKTVTVNSTDNRSNTLSFSFTGTGFDLISACGPDAGVQLVKVNNANETVKMYIVDTYFNDATFTGSDGYLYQVPVIQFKGDYNTYTVETTAVYLSNAGALQTASVQEGTVSVGDDEITYNTATADTDEIKALLDELGIRDIDPEDVELVWMDDDSVLNGGAGAQGVQAQADGDFTLDAVVDKDLVNIVDGIRIYNPLNTEHSYYSETEKGAYYKNILNDLSDTSLSGDFAYVEKGSSGVSISEYKTNGPKNEFYLLPGMSGSTALAFAKPADATRVMISVRAPGGDGEIKIGDKSIVINSATEMYYDITSYVKADGTIAIQNIGSTLIAVNNVKFVGGNDSSQAASISLDSVEMMMTMSIADDEIDEPGVPDDGGSSSSKPSGLLRQLIYELLQKLLDLFKERLREAFSFLR